MHKKRNTILVVDHEPQTKRMLSVFLNGADYKTILSDNGKQAIRLCVSIKPDMVLLELALRDIDGKEVIKAIREWSQVPIIIISSKSDDIEIAKALNMGADGYIIKPFNVEVLLARINACLRKAAILEAGEPEISNGNICINLISHKIFINDKLVSFTPKEYALLRYFMINRDKMLTHREILMEVWGAAHTDNKQYLRVLIGQIRDKIEENPTDPQIIITEPGIGYRMKLMDIPLKISA